MNQTINIEELRSQPCPPSPRKVEKKLTCALIIKSPVRPTRNGSMFTLNLSGQDATSTLRAVCFNEKLFSKFEASSTYDFQQFKLKKGYGGNRVELLIDDFTMVEKAEVQLKVDDYNFTISQILRGEGEHGCFAKVKAKVVSIEDPVTVGVYPDNKTKRESLLADSTGHINLVLWRERAESITFKEGDVLNLEYMVLSKFNNQVSITTTFESIITKVDEDISPCPTRKVPRKSNVVSLVSPVMAMKQFVCTYKCLNCKIDVDPKATSDQMLKCTICSAMFLKKVAQVSNNCMVLLSNNQWFSANARVIQHLFEWHTAKKEPSEEDMILLLSKKYSFRLDLQRRVVEHVKTFEDEDETANSCDDDLERLLQMDDSSLESVVNSAGKSVVNSASEQMDESSSKKLKT